MSSVDKIPDGWVETTLGEVSTRKQYGYTESASTEEVGPKFLRITDIQNDFINWKSVPYCPISDSDLEKYKLQIGDIVIARTGNSTGATATIKEEVNAVFASYLIRFQINPERANYNYIDFLVRSRYWSGFVKSVKSGSAQGGANANDFALFPINLPSLPEQKAIANILTAFDDKIENLQAQNKTLEQTAQTIFAAWFGKYQVGDELPDGWRVGKIYDVLDVQYGFPFKSKLFNEDKKGLPLIRIRDIRKGITGYFTDEEYLNEYIINSGDVLAGMDAVFRPYLWSGQKGLLNQRVCRFIPKKFASRIFVFEFMKPHLSFYEKTKVGTTVIHLGKSDLDFIETVIPNEDVILKFKELSTPIEEKIINNHQQIQTLKKTRDALLPKLMSGQIRVNI